MDYNRSNIEQYYNSNSHRIDCKDIDEYAQRCYILKSVENMITNIHKFMIDKRIITVNIDEHHIKGPRFTFVNGYFILEYKNSQDLPKSINRLDEFGIIKLLKVD
jgi:hypothetical protein